MTFNSSFSSWLASVSPQQLLQKALLKRLAVSFKNLALPTGSVPLSRLKIASDCSYCYESAIAHQISATGAQDAVTLAHLIIDEMMTDRVRREANRSLQSTITLGLDVSLLSPGWLVLTLSSMGIVAWRTAWLQSELPLIAWQGERSAISALIERGNWPLCDRLQLSLPMFLQWAHARCDAWQQEPTWPGRSVSDRAQPVAADTNDRETTAGHWFADEVTHFLLPVVMQTLDQMAARHGEPKTCLRQAYRMAACVYHCDAQMAQFRQRARSGSDSGAAATLAATQKVLALVLSVICQQAPLRSL